MGRTSVETTANRCHGNLNGKERTHGIKDSLIFVIDSMDPDDMNSC